MQRGAGGQRTCALCRVSSGGQEQVEGDVALLGNQERHCAIVGASPHSASDLESRPQRQPTTTEDEMTRGLE